MTRMTARQLAVQLLFSIETNSASAEDTLALFFSNDHYETLHDEDELYLEMPDEEQAEYIRRVILNTESHRNEIDEIISRYSSGWKINRLSKTTLAILRCSICEILYLDDIPKAAAVNEAVELAKGYDEPETVSFINGVLGGFMRDQSKES